MSLFDRMLRIQTENASICGYSDKPAQKDAVQTYLNDQPHSLPKFRRWTLIAGMNVPSLDINSEKGKLLVQRDMHCFPGNSIG